MSVRDLKSDSKEEKGAESKGQMSGKGERKEKRLLVTISDTATAANEKKEKEACSCCHPNSLSKTRNAAPLITE